MVEKTNEIDMTPVKRKRGRPRKTEIVNTTKTTKVNKKTPTKKSTKKVNNKEVKKVVKDYKPDSKLYTCEACLQCQKKCKIQAVKNSVLYRCPDFTPTNTATLKRTAGFDPLFYKDVIEIKNK